jgi:hypothetical protein
MEQPEQTTLALDFASRKPLLYTLLYPHVLLKKTKFSQPFTLFEQRVYNEILAINHRNDKKEAILNYLIPFPSWKEY